MNHIESLQILNNGEVVIDTEVGSSISKNPYFKFQIHGKKGDSITLNFTDTSGKSGSATKKSK
jgi:sulfur-oxidizing protein SoxZ